MDQNEDSPEIRRQIDDVIRKARIEFLRTHFTISERSFAIMVDPKVMDSITKMVMERSDQIKLTLTWLKNVEDEDVKNIPPQLMPEGVAPEDILFLSTEPEQEND